MGAAACSTHRLRRRSAQEANPCTGQRSSCRCSLRAGRSPSHRLASCACASAAADLTPTCVFCGPGTLVRVGAHQPLARASRMPAPPALRRPAGAGAPSRQHRRRPVLPAVLTAAAPTHPPALPREGSESPCRQRCQAFNGQTPHTASVGGRACASRPRPHGRPVAGLDSALASNSVKPGSRTSQRCPATQSHSAVACPQGRQGTLPRPWVP